MSKIILVKPPISARELYGDLAEAGSSEPPLGLAYLASNLRQNGFDADILDALILKLTFKDATEVILKKKPKYVGITAVTIDVYHAAKVAEMIKEKAPQIITIIGGVHVTAVPRETMARFPQFDIGVIGEGEQTLVELLKSLENKVDLRSVDGIIFRQNGNLIMTVPRAFNKDLDSLPMPAWDLLPNLPKYYSIPLYSSDRSPSSSIMTTRGCGMQCTFCFQGAFGRVIRMHSADYILRMIKYLYHTYGIRNIRILDDNFLLKRDRIYEFCQKLIAEKLDLTFSCLSRVDTINEELLKLLKRAGCWQMIYGVESGSQEILDTVKKGVRLEQIEKAIRLTKKARIRSLGYFMIGFPKETKESIEKTIAFAKRLPLDDFKMNILTPFPGSELYTTAYQYGYFNNDWQAMNMYTEPCFIPYGLTKEELVSLRKKAFREFYLRPRIFFSYIRLIRNPAHILKLYKGSKALLTLWIHKNKRSQAFPGKGLFGSVLKDALPVTIITADGIKKRLRNCWPERIGLKFFGLPHLGLKMRAHEISRLMTLNEQDALLDAGCGIGLYSLSLANRVKSVKGVDLDREKIETAKKIATSLKLKNTNFEVADINSLPFADNSFDQVLCSEVIEHIADDRKAILEIFRVLKQNGTLVLTTTSKINLNLQHKDGFNHARPGYTIDGLRSLFQNSGLKVERIRPYGLFFGRLAWNLNRACFESSVLTALTFYPSLFISMLDKLIPGKENRSCLGYVIRLRK